MSRSTCSPFAIWFLDAAANETSPLPSYLQDDGDRLCFQWKFPLQLACRAHGATVQSTIKADAFPLPRLFKTAVTALSLLSPRQNYAHAKNLQTRLHYCYSFFLCRFFNCTSLYCYHLMHNGNNDYLIVKHKNFMRKERIFLICHI